MQFLIILLGIVLYGWAMIFSFPNWANQMEKSMIHYFRPRSYRSRQGVRLFAFLISLVIFFILLLLPTSIVIVIFL
ncbi:hypothetical protein [Risungbinella massiliensis]|uniref:hypothetical protein n=1 Tax=Risungbinella massiliensis TaxID=1329796 RepID=UPI0005CC3E45|nr:hypothetical protein [Risungbinella massiliensis]